MDERTVEASLPSPETESSEAKIARLEAENIELRAQLAVARAEAATDPLTELPTRRVLQGEVEQQLARVRRGVATVALVMMDLDRFKAANDSFGHQQGDAILIGFADRIKVQMRAADSFGRWGGEEFLAILELPIGATIEELKAILDRYHHSITDLDRNPDPNLVEPQTVSIGCVILEANQAATATEIIAAADRNLYESKAAGRNRSTISVFIETGTQTSVTMPSPVSPVPTSV